MRCLGETDRRAGRSLIFNFNQRYREAAFGRSLCLTRGFLFDETLLLNKTLGASRRVTGWRRSADRGCSARDSLLTGNLQGILQNGGLWHPKEADHRP